MERLSILEDYSNPSTSANCGAFQDSLSSVKSENATEKSMPFVGAADATHSKGVHLVLNAAWPHPDSNQQQFEDMFWSSGLLEDNCVQTVHGIQRRMFEGGRQTQNRATIEFQATTENQGM